MKSKASVSKSDRKGWLDVDTPYSEKFIKELKLTIQPSHRKWNLVLKVWQVNEMFLEELVELLKVYFDEVIVNFVNPAPNGNNPFIPVLNLISTQDIDKVYKSLAFAIHPDRGGNNQTMKLLNEAYEKCHKG